jgi:hypothetical protein
MGHTSARLTLEVYARDVDDGDGELDRIKALVNDADWAHTPEPAKAGKHPTGTQQRMRVGVASA